MSTVILTRMRYGDVVVRRKDASFEFMIGLYITIKRLKVPLNHVTVVVVGVAFLNTRQCYLSCFF